MQGLAAPATPPRKRRVLARSVYSVVSRSAQGPQPAAPCCRISTPSKASPGCNGRALAGLGPVKGTPVAPLKKHNSVCRAGARHPLSCFFATIYAGGRVRLGPHPACQAPSPLRGGLRPVLGTPGTLPPARRRRNPDPGGPTARLRGRNPATTARARVASPPRGKARRVAAARPRRSSGRRGGCPPPGGGLGAARRVRHAAARPCRASTVRVFSCAAARRPPAGGVRAAPLRGASNQYPQHTPIIQPISGR